MFLLVFALYSCTSHDPSVPEPWGPSAPEKPQHRFSGARLLRCPLRQFPDAFCSPEMFKLFCFALLIATHSRNPLGQGHLENILIILLLSALWYLPHPRGWILLPLSLCWTECSSFKVFLPLSLFVYFWCYHHTAFLMFILHRFFKTVMKPSFKIIFMLLVTKNYTEMMFT